MDDVERLIARLEDADANVRRDAARMIGFRKYPARAVPALVRALKDEDGRVRQDAALALRRILYTCKTGEEVAGFERMLTEGYVKLREEARPGDKEMPNAGLWVARLRMSAAAKRNSFCKDGELLDTTIRSKDKPRGGMYQKMRAVTNG